MLAVLNIARSNCKGMLWQKLLSQSQALKCAANGTMLKVEVSNRTAKQLALFSTTKNVCADATTHAHDHSRLWTAERFLSATLVGLIPVSLAFPNPFFDYALALSLTAHVHWGIEAIAVDYVRPNVVGKTMSKVALASVYALSVFTLGGLFYFNYTDVGLCQAIRMLWKL